MFLLQQQSTLMSTETCSVLVWGKQANYVFKTSGASVGDDVLFYMMFVLMTQNI